MPSPNTSNPHPYQAFAFRGRAFLCGAQARENSTFQPVVFCVGPAPGRQIELPRDSEAYATESEALRHAEQQAIRWVEDHEDGRGLE